MKRNVLSFPLEKLKQKLQVIIAPRSKTLLAKNLLLADRLKISASKMVFLLCDCTFHGVSGQEAYTVFVR